MEPLGKKPGIFSINPKGTSPGIRRDGAFLLPRAKGQKTLHLESPRIQHSVKGQSLKTLLDSLGMTANTETLDTVAALMGELLPINPRNIDLIKKQIPSKLRKPREESSREKRLFSRALALGLEENTELLERILDMPGFSAPDERKSNGEEGQSFPDLRGLGEALARLLPRYLAKALEDPELSLLARPGRDGRVWIFAPFEFAISQVFFYGVFRILLAGENRQFQKICADIHSGESQRVFILSPGKDGPSLREVERDHSELELLEMDLESR